MGENNRLTTRGGALKRLLLFAGGAAGGIVGGRALVSHGEPAALPVPATPTPKSVDVVLYGRHWRLGSHTTEHGKAPRPDEPRTPKGQIVDVAGNDLGTFKAASVLGYGGALQLQTFDLVDGTIVGIGAGGVHESPFAIIGGTGRYLGASGTYVGKQSPRDLGGDGTAEFKLTFTTRGGLDGV